MTTIDIINALERILIDHPDANEYPHRFQGGQGPVQSVKVELTDNGMVRRPEIVFHTRSY